MANEQLIAGVQALIKATPGVPLSAEAREAHYHKQNRAGKLTPAQRRRARHKANRAGRVLR